MFAWRGDDDSVSYSSQPIVAWALVEKQYRDGPEDETRPVFRSRDGAAVSDVDDVAPLYLAEPGERPEDAQKHALVGLMELERRTLHALENDEREGRLNEHAHDWLAQLRRVVPERLRLPEAWPGGGGAPSLSHELVPDLS